MMKAIVCALLVLTAFWIPAAGAQDTRSAFGAAKTGAASQDPASLRNQAFTDVTVAMRLMRSADELVRKSRSPEGLQTATSLYVQAGQIFERSGAIFQKLAPDNASEMDVQNCQKGVHYCVNSIKQIQRHLAASSTSQPREKPRA
jgi:hypothetical protein